MADVNIMIHGRTYGVGCDPGQDKRVRELGQYIDKRVREIAGSGGPATEAHLLVLSNLVLADELFEVRDQMQQLRNQLAVKTTEVEQLQHEDHSDGPQVTELMAAIKTLESELQQAQQQAADARAQAQTASASDVDPEFEGHMTQAIENLSTRIEGLAKRLSAQAA